MEFILDLLKFTAIMFFLFSFVIAIFIAVALIVRKFKNRKQIRIVKRLNGNTEVTEENNVITSVRNIK